MANGDRDGEPAGERAARLYGLLRPHLDERQRRLLLGAEARGLGHGGITVVAQAAGVRADTVAGACGSWRRARSRGSRGARAAAARSWPRPTGGWCRRWWRWWSRTTRGDPMSPLRWTRKSTRQLAGGADRGRASGVGADTVARLLREQGYSLQGNAKTVEGAQHPDRDAQFRYINDQAREHLAAGEPVISVDTKKKELVGPVRQRRAASGGRRASRERVNVHDFPDPRAGQGDPVRGLRRGRQRRLGQRRHRPRHRRVRGRSRCAAGGRPMGRPATRPPRGC